MNSNPICHPSPAKKMKCSFLDYVQLLMIGWAGWWTRTPSATPVHPKTWNACFCITFNIWCWPDWSMDTNPICHPSPPKKMKCFFFGLRSTSDDWPGWSMDSNPICQPSAAKKMKCYFLDYVQLLMIGWASQWTQTPSSTSLQPKKWNAHFSIMFTSNDQPGLSMDLNPIHHLSPAKKWNAHILIMFNFWWLAGLVNGLKPHPPLLSSWKHEMLVFVLHSTSDVGQAAQWTQTPSATLFHQKNEMLIFGLHSTSDDWPAGWWTQTPSTTPLQSKNEILIFGLRSTSDKQPGWSMDSSPICHPSLAKKMKCSFLDYLQLLIIGQAGRWTQTPSATPLQLIKWNAHFWNTFNFWWSAGLVNGLEPHPPPLSSQKNEMLLFGLHSTSDDWLGWLMDSNPICQPSAAKKMKCYFLDYVQLLMIGWASQWTQTPSSTSLQPKKWNAHFCIMFNF